MHVICHLSSAEDRSCSVIEDTCLLSRANRISFAVFGSNVCTVVRPVCGLRGAELIVVI